MMVIDCVRLKTGTMLLSSHLLQIGPSFGLQRPQGTLSLRKTSVKTPDDFYLPHHTVDDITKARTD